MSIVVSYYIIIVWEIWLGHILSRFLPDFDPIWFVDMDPHSLVPPQSEAGEGVLIVSVPSNDPYVSSSGVDRHSVVSVQGCLKNCVSGRISWKYLNL
ncbi:MAG: hypothetical protein MJE68_33860 [Proteobacteria bacterium]|nr:hypothetical protein [Pseudomonadota bacterium]